MLSLHFWLAATVTVLLLLPGALILYLNRTRERRLMTRIAKDLEYCQAEPYRFRNRYYIRFTSQKTPFFVSTFLLRGKKNLRVVSVWLEPTFRLRLFADRLPAKEEPFMALEDVEVGDPELDRAYVVNSHDAVRVRQLFTPDVCKLIKDLGLDIALNIAGNRIQLDYWIPDAELKLSPDRALQVIKRFMALYFLMNRIPYAGSPFELSEQELTMNIIENRQSICMVCGETIADRAASIVACLTCGTRHHAECWDYFQGCSTYGCGGKRANV